MALVGYGRVSTSDQSVDLQTDALNAVECVKIFVDTASGVRSDRPQLAAALAYVRDGDVLVVWKLDRLGRSLQHLVQVVNELAGRGVGFRSLTEGIDTSTATGNLLLGIFGSFAQFERDLIKERTSAGLAAARARGRRGGRKPSLSPKQIEVARKMHADGDTTVAEIAEALHVSRATIYRHLRPVA